MTDLSDTIIPKSDQLNADDLLAGPHTIKITSVTIKKSGDQPVAIHFEGDNGRAYKPCKSMRRLLFNTWKIKRDNQWTLWPVDMVGKQLTVFNDPNVKWAGQSVGGIRISHVSHIDKEKSILLTVSRGQRKTYTVKPLQVEASIDIDALKIEGEQAAQRGMTTLGAFWQRLPKQAKTKLEDIKNDEWKITAVNADKENQPGTSLDTAGNAGEDSPSSPANKSGAI